MSVANSSKVDLTILRASNLPAKDRNLIGQRTSSDPYIEIYDSNSSLVGRTRTIYRSLNPTWNQSFQLLVPHDTYFSLKLYDEDTYTEPDLMGTLIVNIGPSTPEHRLWYAVYHSSAKHAKGKVELQLRRCPVMVEADEVEIDLSDFPGVIPTIGKDIKIDLKK